MVYLRKINTMTIFTTCLLAVLLSPATLCFAQNNPPLDTTDCLVKQINIGTGVDHLSGDSLYAYSKDTVLVKDRYWRLTMLPENSILATPDCAKILDSSNVATDVWWDWIDMSSSAESRAIGYTSRPTDEGLIPYTDEFWGVYKWPPMYVDSPARFTRTFKIAGEAVQAITFKMEGKAGDIVFIRVDAEPGVAIFDDPEHSYNLRYDSMTNTSATAFVIEKTLSLAPGVHTIDMDLYDAGGICSGLNVKGNISCENAVIVDNTCFGFVDGETCSIMADTIAAPPDTATSLWRKSMEQLKYKLYPNPASNFIRLDAFYKGAYDIAVVNTLGQVVIAFSWFTNGLIELDVRTLPAGNYFVKSITDKGNIIAKFDKL